MAEYNERRKAYFNQLNEEGRVGWNETSGQYLRYSRFHLEVVWQLKRIADALEKEG